MGEKLGISNVGNVGDPEGLVDVVEARSSELSELAGDFDQLQRHALMGATSAMVAHEINNLLSPVRGLAQLALARPEDSDLTRRALECAANQSAQISRVIDALLDFSSPEDAMVLTNVHRSAENALACLPLKGDLGAIVVENDLEEVAVLINPVHLEQAIFNLAHNATRAMSGRGGHLVMASRTQGGRIIISVRDTGPGIEEAIQARLFTPFDPGATGTGLGLYMSRKLLRDSHGDLRLVRSGSEGTEFEIELRLAK